MRLVAAHGLRAEGGGEQSLVACQLASFLRSVILTQHRTHLASCMAASLSRSRSSTDWPGIRTTPKLLLRPGHWWPRQTICWPKPGPITACSRCMSLSVGTRWYAHFDPSPVRYPLLHFFRVCLRFIQAVADYNFIYWSRLLKCCVRW